MPVLGSATRVLVLGSFELIAVFALLLAWSLLCFFFLLRMTQGSFLLTLSFLGVVSVETANKVTTQTIGIDNSLFQNKVVQDFGTIDIVKL